jgi:sulfur-carrier protein
MVEVHLWSGLRRFTEGAGAVEVEAATVAEMLDGLVAAHPGLAPVIAAGVSVMVDGVITSNKFTPIGPANEVFLVQRVKGG